MNGLYSLYPLYPLFSLFSLYSEAVPGAGLVSVELTVGNKEEVEGGRGKRYTSEPVSAANEAAARSQLALAALHAFQEEDSQARTLAPDPSSRVRVRGRRSRNPSISATLCHHLIGVPKCPKMSKRSTERSSVLDAYWYSLQNGRWFSIGQWCLSETDASDWLW
eukprot:3449516-Pyramimonas_sp.AAC.1